MPFNFQAFKTRTLSAIIFVAIMLTGLLWNFWSFVILFALIHWGCWREFIQLMKKINKKKYLVYCVGGLVYITLPILLLIDLSGFNWKFSLPFTPPYNLILPMAIIICMWINDTMAYLVGSFIGKTTFSKISPKKTWEGTIGGAVLCIIAVGLLAQIIIPHDFPIQGYHWFFIAGICAAFGTLGDLLESKLKRLADVKDSGTILPGHGGFLDRFDSLLLATPFVWIYLKVIFLV